MAIEIKSGVDTNVATVNANKEVLVALAALAANSGHATIVCESDEGTKTGARHVLQPEVDDDFKLRVASESLVFHESFAGAALNSAQWSSTVTTQTTAVSGGYLRLNSGSSTAANAVARVQSYRTFSLEHTHQLYIEFPFQYAASSVGILNNTVEVGWFIASGTSAPTDGVFMRINSTGEIRLVLNYNGTETQSAAIANTSPVVFTENTGHRVLISINSTNAELWVDGVLIVSLDKPVSAPGLSVSTALPISFRNYNAASVPASYVQTLIGPVTVTLGGRHNPLGAIEVAAMSGNGGYQGQSGGTMGTTANYANSAAPALATLSNTTAGYSTLGGQWLFATVAGAETDYALFAWQVPAMAAGSMNKNILIRGVRITASNIGAAVATTETALQWGVGVGSTAVSLATAEAATTKAPRRVTVGQQVFAIGAAIGTVANDIDVEFRCPLMAEPGTYVHLILKMPRGTATASQQLRGTAFFDAQFM